MALLAIDSTGKTSRKAYCDTVCRQCCWLEPIYSPGASLHDLIGQVIGSGRRHDTLCIVSNANKVVTMSWTRYCETTRGDVWRAVWRLAEHVRERSVCRHLILFGADVGLFKGAPFPDDYRRIQRDILDLLSHVGLNAGTGMESHYGGFGRFRNRLDASWHILGTHREDAEAYLRAVLTAASSCVTTPRLRVVDMGPAESGACPSVVVSEASWAVPEASSSSSFPGMGGLAAGGRRLSGVGQALLANAEKERWIRCGRENGYMWPRCLQQTSLRVVLCPVDPREGTVLVCTSGDEHTVPQTRLACQMMHSLGWRPHVIVGVAEKGLPPKSWRVGCRATFAWYVSLMPQILACAGDLGGTECFMVMEDSCWPSVCLTPQRVYQELLEREKALWLAALLRPRVYRHRVGDTAVSARAVAGSKCLCGDRKFWRDVDALFAASDKNCSTDAIFQMMVGLGQLHLVYPLLGATMPHFSQRVGQVGTHRLVPQDLAGDLLPLPGGWEANLHSIFSGAGGEGRARR